jgi:putative tricarboxylic transport membrane protein
MGKIDRMSGIFWFIFAVIVIIESYRLGLGTLRRPGPGFLFFWAGIFLATMSLVISLKAWAGRKREGAPESIFGGKNVSKIVLVLASVFLYAFFLERLGFLPLTLLLFLFLLGAMERKGVVFTILTSIAVTAAAYVIFEILLQSQLPRGLLGF